MEYCTIHLAVTPQSGENRAMNPAIPGRMDRSAGCGLFIYVTILFGNAASCAMGQKSIYCYG